MRSIAGVGTDIVFVLVVPRVPAGFSVSVATGIDIAGGAERCNGGNRNIIGIGSGIGIGIGSEEEEVVEAMSKERKPGRRSSLAVESPELRDPRRRQRHSEVAQVCMYVSFGVRFWGLDFG